MKFAINRSVVLLVAALTMGGLSAFGVKRYIEGQVADIEARSKSKMTRVLVPKEDLAKGAELSEKVVAVREVPAEWAHSNAISPQQFDRIESQKLAYPAARGEMLLWSMLEGQRAPSFSARLPNGQRAITVPVDEVNSISGMLQPGDKIDLMATARKDNRAVMFPLLQNVTVLATGSQAVPGSEGKEGGRRTYSTITLEASPADAQRVLAAREVGKLSALLRAPGDATHPYSQRRDAMALLGLGDSQPVVAGDASVPVLYGGGKLDAKSLQRLGSPGVPQAAAAVEPAAQTAPATAPVPATTPKTEPARVATAP